jgi:hypothetical protein
VFLEHVRAYPRRYLRSVWRLTVLALTQPKVQWMYPVEVDVSSAKPLSWGYVELAKVAGPKPFYRYTRPVVWLPGVRFFALHYALLQVPPLGIALVIACGFGVAAATAWRKRRLDEASASFLAASLVVLAFIVFSNAVYKYRWKEVQAILPILCMLLSVVGGRLAERATMLLPTGGQPSGPTPSPRG